jgi:hypothetical protein
MPHLVWEWLSFVLFRHLFSQKGQPSNPSDDSRRRHLSVLLLPKGEAIAQKNKDLFGGFR